MSLKWNEKPKVTDVGQIYYVGELTFDGEPRKSESGSDYHLIRLRAAPHQDFTGVSASTNFMIDPSWLSADFHPNNLKQDEVKIQEARQARKLDQNLTAEQQDILTLAGQDFVFSRNVAGPRSLLRNLFDDSQYEEILSEGVNADPLEFLKFVADTWNGLDSKPVTIILAQQSTDQDGDLSSRFEIQEVVGIHNDKDLENFSNYRSKRAKLLFDLDEL